MAKGDGAKVAKSVIVEDRIKPNKQGSPLPALVHSLVDATKYAPLVAAIWAPVSTLLDIPALTQRWYLYIDTGAEVPDKTASIILSCFSLGFNTLANALLVMRFSSSERWWRPATTASVVCWIVKLVFALVNLGIFGTQTHSQPNYTPAEGLWCAVMSCIIAGCIVILLTIHYFLQFDKPGTARDAAELRVTGRNFMLSVMSLVALFALEALIFSRVEHWTYLDGIYFSLVTSFTIGFGDFYPTYNVTRVLLFPFAVASIALLAVQVGVIVDFIGNRADRRKARWRAKFEKHFQRQSEKNDGEGADEPKVSLVEEIDRLQKMADKEEWMSRMFDLATSLLSLIVFWVVGAVIFSHTEGWAFGGTMYFCYVFFLTIGYGDYEPISSAGRVIFIVYALMAVPVVTSFVVQTVTGLVSAFATRAMQRARDQYAPTRSEEKIFHSHAHYVEHSSQTLDSHYNLSAKDAGERAEEQRELTRLVLDLAVQLEADARSLLIDHLEPGSKAQVILRADRVLHLRALEHVASRAEATAEGGGSDEKVEEKPRVHESPTGWLSRRRPDGILADPGDLVGAERQEEELQRELKDIDTLEQVRRYRQTFASLLSAGSLLLELEGHDRSRFERRLEDEHEKDNGGLLLGGGRKGPAEEAAGIDV